MDRPCLPHGQTLSAERWERRHRAMTLLLLLHAVAIPLYGLAIGLGPHCIVEGLMLAALGAAASVRRLGRRPRALLMTFALMTSSALVVHVSGDEPAAHFHFFVVMALLSVYEDWAPFAVGLAYVSLHHGLVLRRTDGWQEVLVHAFYIAAAGAANVIAWQLNGDVREDTRRTEQRYQQMVDSVSEVIFQLDLGGRWVLLSKAWEEMSGRPVAEALGRRYAEFIHPDDREGARRGGCPRSSAAATRSSTSRCASSPQTATSAGSTCALARRSTRPAASPASSGR